MLLEMAPIGDSFCRSHLHVPKDPILFEYKATFKTINIKHSACQWVIYYIAYIELV